MANAVFLWSPVIITGLIPANLHFITASFTSGLGGSMLPATPINIKLFSTSSDFFISSFLYAAAIHLKALLDMLSIYEDICFFFAMVIGFTLPFSKI